MSLMGIDVGTTGTRAVAFDEEGRVLAQAYREYPLLNPADGLYELEPERVWSDLASCLQKVNADPAVVSDPVVALAVSSQGEAVVPVARDGTVLANSPVSSDLRGIPQAQQMAQEFGSGYLYDITGQFVDPLYSLTKILWWKQTQPNLYEKTWKFLCYGDFVVMKLGLEPVIDYTMAARMMAFDIRSLGWSGDILERLGVGNERFARAVPSGTLIGTIPDQFAEGLGFKRNVKVVAGGHDQPCAALGAGVTRPGEAMYSIGTTECIAPVLPRPLPGLKEIQAPCYPHVVSGQYIIITGSQTGGRLLRWYRDEFGQQESLEAGRSGRDVYDLIIEQAGDEPSNLMVLAHFSGSGMAHNDPFSKGVIYGLTFDSKRGQIIRAILEGITYEQAISVDQLAQAGVEIERLRAVGGGSRSKIWLQIKADILNRSLLSMNTDEASSLGAAMLAGLAAGIFSSPEEAVKQWVKEKDVFNPVLEKNAVYRNRIKEYEKLYQALRNINREGV